MLLFSTLTILAVVGGGHGQPFNSFIEFKGFNVRPFQHSSQVKTAKRFRPVPAVQDRRPQPAQQSPKVQQSFQPNDEHFQYEGPFNTFGSSPTFFTASGNIIEQTRAQADNTKALLKSLGNNRRAAQYIDAVIGSNKCLNNLGGAIDAVENAAKLVEKNGQEILSLFEVVEKIEEEKELTKVVKTSAEILRNLEVLLPSFASEPSNVCDANPEDTVDSFIGLAKIIEDVANAEDLHISDSVRQELMKSSKIVSDVAGFLKKLNKSLSSYTKFCGEGKEYQNEVLIAVVGSLEDLAVLFEGFGDAEKANRIRINGAFVKKIVATFEDLGIDSELDCGSFTALAKVLDELAELIDNVGIERLSEQLGLDLEFL